MNAADAKNIDLPALLAQLGYQEQPVTRQGAWYFSPFREENTPSFKVWQLPSGQWCWKDFGSGEGGNVIAFANCMIGKETSNTAISDALKWLDGLNGSRVASVPDKRPQQPKSGQREGIQQDRFTLVDNKRLNSPQLVNYLEQRGIPRKIAQAHCGQANYYDNQAKKKFFGISFPNVEGGLEIRAATHYKHHVNTGTKAISIIPGHNKEAETVYVFEGFIDFLSYMTLTNQEKPHSPIIVLNSTSFAAQAANFIVSNPGFQAIKRVISFLDNNEAGQKAFDRIAGILEPTGHSLGDCRYLYQDHDLEDLNDYLTKVPLKDRPDFTRTQAKFYDTSASSEHRRHQDRLRENRFKPGM